MASSTLFIDDVIQGFKDLTRDNRRRFLSCAHTHLVNKMSDYFHIPYKTTGREVMGEILDRLEQHYEELL